MIEMKQSGFGLWVQKHPYLIIVSIFTITDIFIGLLYFSAHPQTLRVSFLDVGQGDAVFIEAPNGNQILYDAGPPSGAVLREIGKIMPFWDRTIDVVVLSHPDLDHIGGFPEIFKRYEIGAVLEPGSTSENGVYDSVKVAIANEGAGHLLAQSGMQIELGGGVVADVLYPNHDMAGNETNASSIVLRIRFGTTAFLLSGDLPLEKENILAQNLGKGLQSEVLKLGHHGSRTSTSAYWLSAVEPEVVVISAGKDNRYGHPHAEVVRILEEKKIPALKTFEEGTISFVSDGELVVRD